MHITLIERKMMLTTEYLDALPEIENKYEVDLQYGEKVVFTAEPTTFGNEKGRMLGLQGSKFTLTNRRIIADNGVGVWTVDVPDDIVSCTKAEGGKSIFKSVYILVALNKQIVFDEGKQRLTGFRFYFNKADMARFEEILR